jgi:hypothetical protein
MSLSSKKVQQIHRKTLSECKECGCVADTYNVDGTEDRALWVDKTTELCNRCKKK